MWWPLIFQKIWRFSIRQPFPHIQFCVPRRSRLFGFSFVSQYKKQHLQISQTLICTLSCIGITWDAWLNANYCPHYRHLNQRIWHHFYQVPWVRFWLPTDNSDFLASSKPWWATKNKERKKISILLSSDTFSTQCPLCQSLNYNIAPLSSVVPTLSCTWEPPVELLKLLISRPHHIPIILECLGEGSQASIFLKTSKIFKPLS